MSAEKLKGEMARRINSRAKGARGEREFATLLRAFWASRKPEPRPR